MNQDFIQKLSFLNKTILQCLSISDERAIVKKFVDAANKILEGDYGYSWFRETNDSDFRWLYKSISTPYTPQQPRKNGVMARAFKSKQPIFIPDVLKAGFVRSDVKDYMDSVTVIPVTYKNNNYGTLVICYNKHKKFSEEHKTLSRFIGNSAAQAITISRLYADMEQRVIDRTWELEKSKAEISVAKAKDEAVLASIGDGIIVTDTLGNISVINDSAAFMLGVDKHDAVGKKWVEFVEARDEEGNTIPVEERPFNAALSGTTSLSTHYYVRKDGTVFPAAVTDSPVRLGGEIIGAVLVFRDISKETEIDKAKTEFVSLASHQLRTPLAAINWYSEALVSNDLGTLNEKQRQYAEEIKKSNWRMIELVNDLLNVSRIELGTYVFNAQLVKVTDTAEMALKELENAIEKKAIKIKKKLSVNAEIHTDPKLLKMVFQNLISNAVKYTSEKGTVTITTETTKLHGVSGLSISVEDNGYGIPEHQQDKIFTKLFRADNVKHQEPDGTGLGLYILKSMLAFCGGDIWFESTLGKGSSFHVFLPSQAEVKVA